MTEFEFEATLSRMPEGEELDTLYELGCDDCTFGTNGVTAGVITHREARNLIEAIASLIAQVESVPGLRVTKIEIDPEVTLGQIAKLSGRTRESIRLLINGKRGPGDFPAPINGETGRWRLWRWYEVAEWLGMGDAEQREAALVARAVNAWLDLRALLPSVAPDLPRVVAALEAA